ncbi:MAG: CapA family protein [Deltaproteobacteria bacterium]|nr:CapA family protein [Deltaproteobacteria bacterium]
MSVRAQPLSRRLVACAASLLVAAACAERPAPPGSGSPSASAARAAAPAPIPSARPATATAPAERPVLLAFVGDLSLGLHVGLYLERLARGGEVPPGVEPGYPFGAVAQRLRRADLAIGNLECALTSRGAPPSDRQPLRCPIEAVAALQATGFDLVSVANNHVNDFGRAGFIDTLRQLEKQGLAYFGHAVFFVGPQSPWIREIRGVRLGLLAYYDPPRPPVDEVRRARAQVDVLGVFNHWGSEGLAEPTVGQRELGRALCDAGADFVVGTHAHVLQPIELYRGKLIAYGLGNFVFSGMGQREATRGGAVLEIELGRGTVLGHQLLRTRLDEHGAPHFVEQPGAER